MPRFYFDIRDGTGFDPDQEGIEFDSLDAAEHAAATTAAELGRNRLPLGDAREVTVEVKNEHHQRMITVTVSMQVYRVHPEPLRNKAADYHNLAHSARTVAQWVSAEADRDRLLQKAERWEAQAEAEDPRMPDQDASHTREEGA